MPPNDPQQPPKLFTDTHTDGRTRNMVIYDDFLFVDIFELDAQGKPVAGRALRIPVEVLLKFTEIVKVKRAEAVTQRPYRGEHRHGILGAIRTPAYVASARQLRALGMTYEQIAQKIGGSYVTVMQAIKAGTVASKDPDKVMVRKGRRIHRKKG